MYVCTEHSPQRSAHEGLRARQGAGARPAARGADGPDAEAFGLWARGACKKLYKNCTHSLSDEIAHAL